MPSAPEAEAYLKREGELRLPGRTLREVVGQALEQGRPVRFRAGGQSMRPFIRDGDVVTIEPYGRPGPRIGQVAAFIHPQHGRLALHRITGRSGEGWALQGDNLAGQPDGCIRPEQILGRVTKVERQGRRVRLGLGPEGRLIAALSRGGLLRALAGLAGWARGRSRPR